MKLVFREDGRLPDEIKRLKVTYEHPYTLLRQGNTHVKVRVDGPKEGNKIFLHFSNEKRYQELHSILTNVILTDSQLDIFIDVIEEDGSVISTIINCIILNICYSNIPLIDYPCSITYSSKGCDLVSSEEGSGKIIAVYLMNSKKLVYYKLEGKINMEKLQSLDEMGKIAVEKIYSKLKEYIFSNI